jgi:nucleoside-diphosphate-sugar epimerase
LVTELEPHHEVIGVDRDHGDLRGQDVASRLLQAHKPDVLVHLAAKVGRLFGEDDVLETVGDNAGMTALVAQACGQAGVRMVYASTSEVYGDRGDTVCAEDDLYKWTLEQALTVSHLPHNAYGLSKRWGEEACRLYAPDDLTIWRPSMPYGPGLPHGRGRAAIVNMLWQADNRQPIPVHQGSERSWCWVGDAVRAMRLTLEQPGGVWNIGRDDAGVPMQRVAEMACELTGAPESLIELIPAPPRQTVVKRLATEKLREIGWRPEVELAEGMERTLAWVRELDEVAA